MNTKAININQRIPLNVLETAIVSLLSNDYSNEYILEQLSLEFSGENRLKKSIGIVNKIIINNPLKDYILENKDQIQIAIKRKDDRNMILIALLNSAFPFAFQVLATFGKFFKVQDVVNTELITKTISATYGSNRSMTNGLYSVVPMFLEAGLFKRQKPGIYEFESCMNISSHIAKDIYLESFKINSSLQATAGFIDFENPYFIFVESM